MRSIRGYQWLQVCESYPKQLIVPMNIKDESLVKSSMFRQNRRFPVVCYYHQRTKVSKMCSLYISTDKLTQFKSTYLRLSYFGIRLIWQFSSLKI